MSEENSFNSKLKIQNSKLITHHSPLAPDFVPLGFASLGFASLR